ncbi:MAG: hypothetical protein ABIS09_08190 [Sphingomicrobium sp.]
MDKQRLGAPASRRWTKPDDYVEGLVRRRNSRRGRHLTRGRTEPETPRPMLSTVPFAALILALAMLSVAIMIAAWPGGYAAPSASQAAPTERGVAAKGWFQDAQKEMKR